MAKHTPSEMDARAVSMIREAAKEILGLNYTLVDDDLRSLAALAKRACEAGMLDGMHPDTERAIREFYAGKADATEGP